MVKWLNPTYRSLRRHYMARFRQWEVLRRDFPAEAAAQLRQRLSEHRGETHWTAGASLERLLELSAIRGEPWRHVEASVLEALKQGEL
jgi:hypothetical protein